MPGGTRGCWRRPETDSRAVGEVILNNTNMLFTILVKTESMNLQVLKKSIAR